MPRSVYFGSLCGDDPFWNGSLTWNNSWPQFTECFQNTVLIWVPCTLVWLLSLFYGPYLYRRNLSPLPVSALHVAKMVLCILIIIVSLVDMLELYSTVPESRPALAEVTGYIIKILTMFLVMLLLFMERRKGLISSTIQFIFWFLFFLGNIVPFYSKIILQEYNQYILKFTMFYIVFFFITLSLVLHSISEKLQRRRRGVKKPCPSTESSFLSQLTFWWLKSLIVLGYKKPLEEKDIWDLELIDKSKSVVSTFERNWLKEKAKLESKQQRDDAEVSPTEKTPLLLGPVKQKEKSKSSLLKVLLKSYGLRLLLAHMGKLLYDVVIFLNPVILRFLIDFVENKEEEEWKGYVYAVGLALCGLIQSFCFHHVFHESWRVGMRVKTAVIAAIYKKALTMSSQARKASTVGEIVNMMSVDAQYLLDMSPYLWSLWSGPLQCIVSIIMLFNTLGPSVFSGLAVMILLVPVNIFISYRYQQLQEEQMKEKDHRIKLTNEVLNGIKILKLYAWEIPFKEKILEIRERELNCLRKAAKLDAFAVFSWTVAPYLVSLATFGTYIFISKDHYLSPQIAFVSLSLFNILRFAINLTPLVITDIVKANVSLKRMNAFLNHDDLDMSSVGHNPSKGYTISVSDGSFVWDPEIGPCLKDINLKVHKGQLVAVVGQVGSGKSSLISAVLGEMQKIKGQVDIKGSVAYVPQEAWIQNATVRDNILFGREYTEHYHDVLHACALVQDLEILPGGDMTEIGEKGINLSGGQKQRVSLARAVYSDADIYLLDDPLSAVDANVGKHIFENLIGSEGLLAHKTRILVTHGIQWLSKVDVIVVLVHGRITEMGSSEDLLSSSGAFSQFLKNYLREKNLKEDNSEISEVTSRIFERLTSVHSETELSVEDGAHRSFSETSYHSKSLRDIRIQRTKSLELSIKEETTVTNVERLIEDEKSEIGQVKWSVFAAYARCIGIRFVVLIFGVYTLFNISSVASNLWLSKWTEDPVLSNRSLAADSPVYRKQNDFYLGIYGALGVLQSICVLLFSYTALMKMLAASGRLHSEMLSNIIRCQMAFFDTTPIGRIVNRFSKDVDIIDTLLPNIFPQWIDSFFLTITTLVVISYSTPIFLVVVLPVTVIYLLIQRAFIPTCRQLKRLESTTRSPIYNHFGETITGASVIRAFGAEQRFIDESARRVDNNQAYFFAGASSKRWVGLWLEILGSCIVLAAAVFAVISRNDNRTNGGLVGLSISYALEITMTLAWFLRLTSDLETNIVSVERVKEYIDVPTEAAWRKDYDYFPQKWPASGIVDFNSYGTRYRPGLDLVLRNITLNIADGEKVGIVGRTGAGKSSLTLSLFRLIEAACGNIDVDHLGIERLGLHDLRSRLTILPQDPLLFSGTLRMNLDPFGKYSDDEIWSALQHSHLKTYIENLPGQLEHECGEGGLNLSVGQRQLLCLARSLLRKSKVLILDEATAAVDLETDELIQRTMREEFEDCTVLTIAHRLNTIMDYDRILVMENGEVQEFDKPKTLLKNKDSLFYKLVKDAGIVD